MSEGESLRPKEKMIRHSQNETVSEPLGKTGPASGIDFLVDVPVRVVAMLGKTKMTIREILELRVGSVVRLDTPVGENLEFAINGVPFAKVDVTVIEDTYGLRVAEIVNPFER